MRIQRAGHKAMDGRLPVQGPGTGLTRHRQPAGSALNSHPKTPAAQNSRIALTKLT